MIGAASSMVGIRCGSSWLCAAFVNLADAADAAPEQTTQNEMVQVTADRMVSDSRSDQVVFTGNVEARRGDLYVKADRLEVKQDRQSQEDGADGRHWQCVHSSRRAVGDG